MVTTADLLQATVYMVFENAVAQPASCAMYADLCLRLSMELPSFPPPYGETKPVTFKRVLLNTCQDEFEGTIAAREVSAGPATFGSYGLQLTGVDVAANLASDG